MKDRFIPLFCFGFASMLFGAAGNGAFARPEYLSFTADIEARDGAGEPLAGIRFYMEAFARANADGETDGMDEPFLGRDSYRCSSEGVTGVQGLLRLACQIPSRLAEEFDSPPVELRDPHFTNLATRVLGSTSTSIHVAYVLTPTPIQELPLAQKFAPG